MNDEMCLEYKKHGLALPHKWGWRRRQHWWKRIFYPYYTCCLLCHTPMPDTERLPEWPR